MPSSVFIRTSGRVLDYTVFEGPSFCVSVHACVLLAPGSVATCREGEGKREGGLSLLSVSELDTELLSMVHLVHRPSHLC